MSITFDLQSIFLDFQLFQELLEKNMRPSNYLSILITFNIIKPSNPCLQRRY